LANVLPASSRQIGAGLQNAGRPVAGGFFCRQDAGSTLQDEFPVK